MVFPPYAQLTQSICTSETLTASSCLSSAFTASRHSSLVYRVAHTYLLRFRYADCIQIHIQLATYLHSLVRVSRRGRTARLPAQFHLFNIFFRSLYLSTIGLGAIFSLGWTLPPTSQFNTKHCYSTLMTQAMGLSPSKACLSRQFLLTSLTSHYKNSDCTTGSSFFARRYCGNPC